MKATTLVAYSTPPGSPSWRRWFVCSPLARIVIFVVLFLALNRLFTTLLQLLIHGTEKTKMGVALGDFFVAALPAVVAYLLLTCIIERRKPEELALRRWPDAIPGLLAGSVLFSLVVATLWMFGSYRVIGFNHHTQWLSAFLKDGIGAAIFEEIVFRGVIFRITEEGLGSWAALVISSLIFGFMHGSNPGATAWSSSAIAIEAGLLFGLLFHVTRSLPICFGLHAAWNFCQGTVYGIPVSGLKADGWLVSTRSGPAWLSGGVFGAEASVVALTLCSVCSIALLIVALKRHTLVPPSWRRR